MSANNEELLDLALIPEELYPYLVEKMNYKDLIEFNSCSKLSSEMCKALSRFHLSVYKIGVTEDGQMFIMFAEEGAPLLLDRIPECLAIRGEFFAAEKSAYRHVVDCVKHSKVIAQQVIFTDLADELDYVEDLMEILKPDSFAGFSTNRRLMSLDAVRKMSDVRSFDDEVEGDYDDVLLGLIAKTIYIGGNTVTVQGVARFIQEWLDGIRPITKIQLGIENFTFEEFRNLLGPASTTDCIEFDPTKIFICRSTDHSDCLAADIVYDYGSTIGVVFTATSGDNVCSKHACST